MTSQLLLFQLTKKRALQIIRAAAADNTKLIWTHHVGVRMRERKINDIQIIRCLEDGKLTEGPKWRKSTHDWDCRIQRISAGQRIDIRLAIDGENVVLITVI